MKTKGQIFFSIVIPAHNEENYIADTLQKLEKLNYPKDLFEIIVVENGSSDKTFEVANKYANARTHVYSIKERGVSHARNYGITKVHPSAQWVFFLDADTFVDPPFLDTIDAFLKKHADRNYVVGSVSLQPHPVTPLMSFFYGSSNLLVWFTRAVYGGALLVRKDVLEKVQFDENVQVREDAQLTGTARKMGKYFFMFTFLAHTSTRRLRSGQWFGAWFFAIFVPPSVRRYISYRVIR